MAYSGTSEDRQGHLYLLTLTAPGDVAHGHAGGICPCTPVGGVNLAEWNASHSRRWNLFMTKLRRLPGCGDLQYLRGIEVQQRGALHDHAILRATVPVTLAAVRRLAIESGFGHSVTLDAVVAGSRKAARYVAKYVGKATDKRADVPWRGELVDTTTGEITVGQVEARYRTWSASQSYGDKMALVRARAAVYARSQAQQAADDQLAIARSVVVDVMGDVQVLDYGSDPPI